MPNSFAYGALIIWPFVSLVLYMRLQTLVATFWTIVGAFLLLPAAVEINFPLLPPLNKETIAALSALVGCMFIKKAGARLLPASAPEKWMFLVLLFVPFVTTYNNPEPIFNDAGLVRGLTYHDALSASIHQYLALIPFLLGLHLVKTQDDQLQIFKLLAISALWYSLPILFEVRMSPQLHTWIYGFFPHGFAQHIRFGGYRPLVFLSHALLIGMYVAVALGAMALISRKRVNVYGLQSSFLVVYLAIVLLLCKTVGAYLYGAFLLLVIFWVPHRMTKRLVVMLTLMVFAYPLISLLDLFPTQILLDLATTFDPERAESLGFRFVHEATMLNHALEKPFFGWGSWGRFLLPGSVSDGYWIIVFGEYGIFGFAMVFGLMTLAIFRATKSAGYLVDRDEAKTQIIHALVVSVMMVDQLPNDSMNGWVWFFIGALLGRSNYLLQLQRPVAGYRVSAAS